MPWARDGSGLLVKRIRGKTYPRYAFCGFAPSFMHGRHHGSRWNAGRTSHPAWWRWLRKTDAC